MAGLEDIIENEDFYSLMNVPRDASKEELRVSYRRLCMLYHPDKHTNENRREATEVFNKVQYAYDVLSDSSKRHIYDAYGKKGLEADWQLVERKKTPQEIHEEYERLQRKRQLQRMEEVTQPTGNFSMTVDATSLFDSPASYEDEYYDAITMPEIAKISISQSVQAPLSTSHTATISGSMESKNGRGKGDLMMSLRQIVSPVMWGELSLGLSDRKYTTLGLRGYRTISQGLFAVVYVPITVIVQDNICLVTCPAYSSMIGYQIRDNLAGTLELTSGHVEKLCTELVYNRKPLRIIGKVQVGDPHSYVQVQTIYSFLSGKAEASATLKILSDGFLFEYGAEHQVSKFSRVGATVCIGSPAGVVLNLRLNRASQSYFIPILLSDELNFVAVFYATAVPAVFYFALQKLIVQPYLRRKKLEEEESEESSRSQETALRKAESERQVHLMRESVDRKVVAETSKHGLIVIDAWYGKLVTNGDQQLPPQKVVNVKIPLQNLIENSTVQLPPDISKSGLPGFYDPCPGCEKSLKVYYKFRNRRHEVLIGDKEKLRMPLMSHLLDADGAS